ncbi:MAG: rhodanese-like domain-containing protein [Pseudomonadota bacterium]
MRALMSILIKTQRKEVIFFLSIFSCVLFLILSQLVSAEAPFTIRGVSTVDLQDAKILHQAGALFIDVRDKNAWTIGHIIGAVHLDFAAEEFIQLHENKNLDRKTPIVFYSNNNLTSEAAMASFFARKWGYEEIYYFRDGYYSWLAGDAAVEFGIGSEIATAEAETFTR